MFDFGKISDNQYAPANVSLSADTQALLLAYLSSFPFQFDWLWDGDEPTTAQWDEIQEAIALAVYELTTEAGMILHADIYLGSDVASYTLTDLASLPGKDLIIQCKLAGTLTPGQPDMYIRFNGVTTALYNAQSNKFETSTLYRLNLFQTYFKYSYLVATWASPQFEFHRSVFEIPDFNQSVAYRNMFVKGSAARFTVLGSGVWIPSEEIDSMEFWLSSGDLREGSNFAVYTRG